MMMKTEDQLENIFRKLADRQEYQDINKILELKESITYSSKTPMGRNFEDKHVTNDNDRNWLANPSNEPSFKVNDYINWEYKQVNLYPFGTPQPADVNQHAIGDCSLLAVLASFAYLYPDFIKHIIQPIGDSVFKVAMYDPQGNPVDVVVDSKFLCNGRGDVGQSTGKNGAITWATVMEKALMKWEDVYQCHSIGGIATENSSPPFTGNGDSFAIRPGSLYTGEMIKVVDYALQNGMISIGGFTVTGVKLGELETIAGHAFTVMYTTNPNQYLWSMRNPWGISSVDGVLDIPNKREITQTIDFRLVYPGHAREFLRKDLGGYIVPKFSPNFNDLFASKVLLRMVGLEHYGPEPPKDIE